MLQQVENFGDPTFGVTDAFKPVVRYWDRITHPAQVIQSLPQALQTLLDRRTVVQRLLGFPQDVQGWAYEFPLQFFRERTHVVREVIADPRRSRRRRRDIGSEEASDNRRRRGPVR